MSIKLNSRIQTRSVILVLLFVMLLLPGVSQSVAGTLKAQAQYLPWSGWWWPMSRGNLVFGYNGHPSPAEKYDLYTVGHYPGVATREGRTEWFKLDASAWNGFCNGWVNASILERYEIKPSSRNGVFFSVGDKKGILAACHVNDEVLFEYCQQSPEPFHRYLLQYVGEEKGIVGADLDSSTAFWSYPIFAYEMQISEGVKSDYVICKITFADDFVDPDYVGTKELSRTYHYRLDKDEDGRYSGSGAWLQGDDEGLHPQLVWIPIAVNPDKLFIDYEKVTEFTRSVDDDLEGEKIVPGHHLLIVYPNERDSFNLTPEVGEIIKLKLARDLQSLNENGAIFRLLKNEIVVKEKILSEELDNFSITSETGNDNFKLEIVSMPDNTDGVCVHLYVDVEADYVSWFYDTPSTSYWFGSACVNEGQSAKMRAWLVPVGSGNLPIGRGACSGNRMDNFGRWLEVFENQQTEDYFSDNAKPQAVKIVSNQPFQSLFLIGNNLKLWGGAGQNLSPKNEDRLAIPWLTSSFDMQKFATLFLASNSPQEEEIKISYFRKDGKPISTVSGYTLHSGSINEYKSGKYPELGGGADGWAVIETTGANLTGKVDLVEGYGRADQLPLLRFSRIAYLPHVVRESEWKSVLGLCNPHEIPLEISLVAYFDGEKAPLTYTTEINPHAKYEIELKESYFGLNSEQFNRSWISIEGNADYGAYSRILYGQKSAASIPLSMFEDEKNSRRLSQLALSDGWWTGIVLINPEPYPVSINLSVLNENGEVEQVKKVLLEANGKFTESIRSFFSDVEASDMATLHLEGNEVSKVKALAVYGGNGVNHLAMLLW